jgi:uncharacterized membrane protein YkoI
MIIKSKFIWSLPLLLATLGACASSTSTSTDTTSESAKTKAVQIVPGTVTAVEDNTTEQRWVVKVKHANGATLEVEFEKATGNLVEVKDFKGPFEYELTPMTGVLKYTEARGKATTSKPGKVEAWKFESEDGKKQYEFYVRASANERLYEIKMTADKGDITATVEKEKVD